MKKLLLILAFLIPLLSFGQTDKWIIKKTNYADSVYRTQWKPDGGVLQSFGLTKSYMAMAEKNDISTSIEFAWLGVGASSTTPNGTYSYLNQLNTAYSFYGTNHGTQTTSTSQPFEVGTIAPNENAGIKNPNGGARYLTHPTISFAATDAWSVTTCLKSSDDKSHGEYTGSQSLGSLIVVSIGTRIYTYSDNSAGIIGNSFNYDFTKNSGKNTIITIVCNGDSKMHLYINGSYIIESNATTNSTALSFTDLFKGRNGSAYGFKGTISAHIIRRAALTAPQVQAEYNLLSSIYPPIFNTTINGYDVATTNFDAVSSSNGTIIADGSVQATWASNATAYWCYHSDNIRGAIYNKLYNKQARDIIIANPPSGWHVSTQAELTAIALNGGNNLKKEGTDYWATTGGTNLTGFSAIGGASRNADGTFNTIKNTATFWCADSDNVLLLNHNDNTATITATTSAKGHSIRLIKN